MTEAGRGRGVRPWIRWGFSLLAGGALFGLLLWPLAGVLAVPIGMWVHPEAALPPALLFPVWAVAGFLALALGGWVAERLAGAEIHPRPAWVLSGLLLLVTVWDIWNLGADALLGGWRFWAVLPVLVAAPWVATRSRRLGQVRSDAAGERLSREPPRDGRILRSDRRPWVEVWDLGQGPALIAIPPALGDVRTVHPVFAPLASSYRVLGYSLRGERGHEVSADFTWEDLVEDLGEVYRMAGIDRAVLIGTSFGGAVALRFTLDHPERVDALVLNVTSARMLDMDFWRGLHRKLHSTFVPASMAFIRLYSLLACGREFFRLGLGEGASRLREMFRFLRRHGTPGPTLSRRIGLFLEMDLEDRLDEIACPTLVLTGEEDLDRMTPRKSQRTLLDRIPKVRHQVLEGTGHLGILTRPERVRRACAAFLDQLRESGLLLPPEPEPPLPRG